MKHPDIFQVIADPSRRQILMLLSNESKSINALAENFQMSRPAVSKHIKLLSHAGFIAIEDIGRERHCKLKKEGFTELKNWLDYYDQFWKQKLNNLSQIIQKTTSHESNK